MYFIVNYCTGPPAPPTSPDHFISGSGLPLARHLSSALPPGAGVVEGAEEGTEVGVETEAGAGVETEAEAGLETEAGSRVGVRPTNLS